MSSRRVIIVLTFVRSSPTALGSWSNDSDLFSSICYPDFVIHLCLVTLCLGWHFERDTFCRITFELVHHIGIHLSSGKIAMGKQLAHGVDVRSLSQLQSGEGMAEAVEGDVLLNAGSLYPGFEIQCHCTVREVLEHLPCATLTTELQSLFADRQDCSGGSLLCDNVHSPATISQLDDVLPLESDAVREAKTCETGEKTCTAEDITLARSLRQLQQFFFGEELPLVAMSFGTHEFLGYVLFE